MNEKVLSSDHIYLTKDVDGIVDLYMRKSEYDKAINFFSKEIRCIRKSSTNLTNRTVY
jgi:hypothetical protein